MKTNNEPKEDGVRVTFPSGRTYVCLWVVCPDCGVGRHLAIGLARKPGYTGRCRKCYLKVAKSGWSSGSTW